MPCWLRHVLAGIVGFVGFVHSYLFFTVCCALIRIKAGIETHKDYPFSPGPSYPSATQAADQADGGMNAA